MEGRVLHPSLARLKRLAAALGDLANEIVFIGGALAPILQLEPPFEEARLTTDVDAVILTASYAQARVFHERLGERGFRQDLLAVPHVHRWISPDGDDLDVVPAGKHLGASGQQWDEIAVATSQTYHLGGGILIRHANATAFLAQKWAAFRDRGADDPFTSIDLEDILALVASRPQIVRELEESSPELREFVRNQTRLLLANTRLKDLLAGHLNTAENPQAVIVGVRGRLEAIAV
jgi:hypothetical protein